MPPLHAIDAGTPLSYRAEGAANVVFSFAPSHPYHGKLLRLPKDIVTRVPYEQVQRYWESNIEPLFDRTELVQQTLVPVTSDVIAKLNEQMTPHRHSSQAVNCTIRPEWSVQKLAAVDVGMLVEDLAPTGNGVYSAYDLREIKPKWLSQSLNAPTSATRCRNCAREAMRGYGYHQGYLCPLNLIRAQDEGTSSKSELVPTSLPSSISRTAIAKCIGKLDSASTKLNTSALETWLRHNPLLKKLQDAQSRLDRFGPLEAEKDRDSFALAMTLRDCSLYLLIPKAGAEVIAKLGDLDMKNATEKMKHWKGTEEKLIERGLYFDGVGPVTDCALRS